MFLIRVKFLFMLLKEDGWLDLHQEMSRGIQCEGEPGEWVLPPPTHLQQRKGRVRAHSGASGVQEGGCQPETVKDNMHLAQNDAAPKALDSRDWLGGTDHVTVIHTTGSMSFPKERHRQWNVFREGLHWRGLGTVHTPQEWLEHVSQRW